MATYRLRSLAQDDLETIWNNTVEQWGIDQAERYLDMLFTCFDDLAANPLLGRQRDEVNPGYRSFPQGRHVVFYKLEPTGIEIIGIVHQRVDVDRHLDTI